MKIDAGLDTGDILLAWETEIGPEETAVELAPRLGAAGADLLMETIEGLTEGRLRPRPQDPGQASYAPVLEREKGQIDWRWLAEKIHNRVRGFQPWPGCYTWFRGGLLQVWRTRRSLEPAHAVPGSLRPMGRRLLVACGEETALELLEVQQAGRKRLAVDAFLSGQRVEQNEVLGEQVQ
jgi:methionyl-tRNA formyltransferase